MCQCLDELCVYARVCVRVPATSGNAQNLFAFLREQSAVKVELLRGKVQVN